MSRKREKKHNIKIIQLEAFQTVYIIYTTIKKYVNGAIKFKSVY